MIFKCYPIKNDILNTSGITDDSNFIRKEIRLIYGGKKTSKSKKEI